MEQNLDKIIIKNEYNSFQNSFKLCKFSTFNFFFLGLVILHKSITISFTGMHNFGLVWPKNINNVSNTLTLVQLDNIQNSILVKRAWFWHVASQVI